MAVKRYRGVVQKGHGHGATLGFPTVNIPLEDGADPGIYAGYVYLDEGRPIMAAIYADKKRGVLEAHLVDFTGDLYGKEIVIEMHKKIRESKRFSNDSELRAMIRDDIGMIKEHFKNSHD